MLAVGLTPFAWAFMVLSIGAVTFLVVWCFYRILTSRSEFGGLEPDTGATGGEAAEASGTGGDGGA